MKQKHKSIKIEHNSSAREYLHILVSNYHYFKILNLKNKPYTSVVIWFENNISKLQDHETSYPNIGTIAKEIGIDGPKLKTFLKSIHQDILDFNHSNPNSFKFNYPILVSIFFKGLYANSYFNIGMQALPYIGDRFSFNFLKPITGVDLYYVSEISHDFNTGGHEISISTSLSEPFQYLRLIKEKAYLNGEISLIDFISREDHQFEKELVKMYHHL